MSGVVTTVVGAIQNLITNLFIRNKKEETESEEDE